MPEYFKVLISVIIFAIAIAFLIRKRRKYNFGRKLKVVQAKRYQTKVGIKAIQEVFSAMHYYDAEKSYLFTNSYFTKSASVLAKKLNVELCDLQQIEALKEKYF